MERYLNPLLLVAVAASAPPVPPVAPPALSFPAWLRASWDRSVVEGLVGTVVGEGLLVIEGLVCETHWLPQPPQQSVQQRGCGGEGLR